MHLRSLAEPTNARLRDAALLLNVIDQALTRGSDAALNTLAGAIKDVERKEPGVFWGMSPSGTLAMRPLAMRKGKGEKAPQTLKLLLRQLDDMLTTRWPAMMIGQLLGGQIAMLFPEYVKSAEQRTAMIARIQGAVEDAREEADARQVRRGIIDPEKFLVSALELAGMPSADAWDRIKGTFGRPKRKR